MKTTMRMSVLFASLIAVAILFGARGADAHEYFVGKNVPLPVGQDGKRRIQISAGETISLTVKNAEGQNCSAFIVAEGFSTEFITVTTSQPVGAVPTREFRITGQGTGTTEIDITVKGVDPCTEDSHNPLVVQVLPSETEILRDFGLAGKSESKLLKLSLKTHLNVLALGSSMQLDQFSNGVIAPDVAAHGLLDGWYEAWAAGFYEGRSVLQNLTNYGTSLLSSGGWPECTSPLRFAEGMGGPFDVLRTSVRGQLDGYRGKVAKQIDSDIAAYGKIGLKYGIKFTPSFDLGYYPEISVSGPAVNTRPADPGAPLYVGYAGAATWSTEFDSMSCVAFGGLALPASGPVRIDLLDGEGVVQTKVVSVEGAGFWDVMFDDLVAGKTYRASATYNGGAEGHDTRSIFLSPLRF